MSVCMCEAELSVYCAVLQLYVCLPLLPPPKAQVGTFSRLVLSLAMPAKARATNSVLVRASARHLPPLTTHHSPPTTSEYSAGRQWRSPFNLLPKFLRVNEVDVSSNASSSPAHAIDVEVYFLFSRPDCSDAFFRVPRQTLGARPPNAPKQLPTHATPDALALELIVIVSWSANSKPDFSLVPSQSSFLPSPPKREERNRWEAWAGHVALTPETKREKNMPCQTGENHVTFESTDDQMVSLFPPCLYEIGYIAMPVTDAIHDTLSFISRHPSNDTHSVNSLPLHIETISVHCFLIRPLSPAPLTHPSPDSGRQKNTPNKLSFPVLRLSIKVVKDQAFFELFTRE